MRQNRHVLTLLSAKEWLCRHSRQNTQCKSTMGIRSLSTETKRQICYRRVACGTSVHVLTAPIQSRSVRFVCPGPCTHRVPHNGRFRCNTYNCPSLDNHLANPGPVLRMRAALEMRVRHHKSVGNTPPTPWYKVSWKSEMSTIPGNIYSSLVRRAAGRSSPLIWYPPSK